MNSVCKAHYHTSSEVQMILACPHLASVLLVSSETKTKKGHATTKVQEHDCVFNRMVCVSGVLAPQSTKLLWRK